MTMAWKRNSAPITRPEDDLCSSFKNLSVKNNFKKRFNLDDYLHILEAYGLKSTDTADILSENILKHTKDRFKVHVVDQERCLVVFSSSDSARTCLNNSRENVKLRNIRTASYESLQKLKTSPGDWSLPYKERPSVDPSVANRLINFHLGISNRKSTPIPLLTETEDDTKPRTKSILKPKEARIPEAVNSHERPKFDKSNIENLIKNHLAS